MALVKLCFALLLAAAIPGSMGVRIDHPHYKGIKVDWCASFASNCGKPAADAFCQKVGFEKATDFDGPFHVTSGKEECFRYMVLMGVRRCCAMLFVATRAVILLGSDQHAMHSALLAGAPVCVDRRTGMHGSCVCV